MTIPLAVLLRLENITGIPEISLVLCDDAFIQALNAQYRGKGTPTDVLSFAQDDPEMLGDIVISLPTAARQAEAAQWTLENEVALLGVHGLLHLLGYDDETEAGAWEMQAKTEAVLREAGIPVPDAGMHPFFGTYPAASGDPPEAGR